MLDRLDVQLVAPIADEMTAETLPEIEPQAGSSVVFPVRAYRITGVMKMLMTAFSVDGDSLRPLQFGP